MRRHGARAKLRQMPHDTVPSTADDILNSEPDFFLLYLESLSGYLEFCIVRNTASGMQCSVWKDSASITVQ